MGRTASKRNRDILYFILPLVCILAAFFAGAQKAYAAGDTMKITAIDLLGANTGEAAMISDGTGKSLLIDSGDNHNRSIFAWLNGNGYREKQFDALVTHWHDDHAGNTAEIIEKYNVGTVYIPPLSYLHGEDTGYYAYERTYADNILKAAKKRGTKIVYLKKGLTVRVGTVKGKVLYCCGSPRSENWYDVQYINNQSSVIMFSGGGSKFLTAGDIQAQAEKRILKSGVSLKADIFKLSHHGYIRSNRQDFIEAVSPTYAYFSCNKSTPSKFLSTDLVDCAGRMAKIANVMSTRYNGTITYTCSGGEIAARAERNTVRMYQKLIPVASGKTRTVTYVFNNASRINMTRKILNTDKYYNRQLGADGSAFTGSWVKSGGRYFLKKNGVCAYNTFAVKNGKTYWFDFHGRRKESGFVNAYGKRYYVNPFRVSGWKKIGGARYYFMDSKYVRYSKANEGMQLTGFKTIGGSLYYLQDKRCRSYKSAAHGKLMTGFFVVNGQTYYGANSKMEGYRPSEAGAVQKGWTRVNGNLYYMGDDGIIRKGWQTIGGKRYYMYPGGTTAVSRFVTIDGKRYYFDENGVMQTGLVKIGDDFYYFDENGVMQTGPVEINGKTLFFEEDGRLRKEPEEPAGQAGTEQEAAPAATTEQAAATTEQAAATEESAEEEEAPQAENGEEPQEAAENASEGSDLPSAEDLYPAGGESGGRDDDGQKEQPSDTGENAETGESGEIGESADSGESADTGATSGALPSGSADI